MKMLSIKHQQVLFFLVIFFSFRSEAQQTLVVDGSKTGSVFEGVGALSAGASSRLLMDYPEPYRSDILDYLFKPGFGANLWQLKVENGGDVNSTDGAELSYAHNREEFLHPQAAYFNRGYEWWLIREAQKRNPGIGIEILQWGAPGWVGNGKFYSRDNAEFIAGYIRGLKRHHGIQVDYTGIRNEVPPDTAWIVLLRKTLDADGLSAVKIDAGDQWKPEDQWKIAGEMLKDPELNRAIYAINAHVPEMINFYTPPEVHQIHKPVWSGESHFTGGDWYAAATEATINNRSYPLAGITRVIYWSLITSYPDYLSAPASGFMEANTPWSGHYSVQPPLWIAAHVNQFARPGWKYVSGGSRYFDREGWSVITLEDTLTHDYSMIFETMSAKEKQAVHVKLSGGLRDKPLAVWRSTFRDMIFEKEADITPLQREFTITLQPNSVYSLTTTRGQQKGVAGHRVPPPRPFPRVYKDDFNRDSLNREPPWWINYQGAFEVVKDPYGQNRYLEQQSLRRGIDWFPQPYPMIIFGDMAWKDTRLAVDFLLPDTGVVRLESRLNNLAWNSYPEGYSFQIRDDGEWRLQLAGKTTILQQGRHAPVKGRWHRLEMDCTGSRISVSIDGFPLAEVNDHSYGHGILALSSGWNRACFDNVDVEAKK